MKNPPADLSQEKRSKILQAAKARFLYYGVSKTTTRDIAEDLGISVSNLYLYFENKREIVLAIANECRGEQDKLDQQILADSTLKPAEKLEKLLVEKFRIVDSYRSTSTTTPKGAELFAYLLQEYPERIALWNANFEQLIFTVLEEGAKAGDFQFQDVRQAAHMFRISLIHFFLPPHIQLPEPPTEAELVAFIRWQLSLFTPPTP